MVFFGSSAWRFVHPRDHALHVNSNPPFEHSFGQFLAIVEELIDLGDQPRNTPTDSSPSVPTLLSASCDEISENSATCANCRLDFPLPFPPRRPPLASTSPAPLLEPLSHHWWSGSSSSMSVSSSATPSTSHKDGRPRNDGGIGSSRRRGGEEAIDTAYAMGATACIWQRRRKTMEKLKELIKRARSKHYVHPAYRSLLRERHSNKIASARLVLDKRKSAREVAATLSTLRARKRSLLLTNPKPLPRVPVFRCSKCGLASNHLKMLTSHVCTKKLPPGSAPDPQNVENLVRNGIRGKGAKDAYSLMERISNPQTIRTPTLSAMKHTNPRAEEASSMSKMPVSSLAELAFKQVSATHLSFETIVAALEPINVDTAAELDASRMVRSEDSRGWYCPDCSRLFPRYMDFDEHLPIHSQNGNAKLVEPLEIKVSTSSLHPTIGSLMTSPKAKRIRKSSMLHNGPPSHPNEQKGDGQGGLLNGTSSNGEGERARSSRNSSGNGGNRYEENSFYSYRHFGWRCTKCKRDDFTGSAELHAHILKCAKN